MWFSSSVILTPFDLSNKRNYATGSSKESSKKIVSSTDPTAFLSCKPDTFPDFNFQCWSRQLNHLFFLVWRINTFIRKWMLCKCTNNWRSRKQDVDDEMTSFWCETLLSHFYIFWIHCMNSHSPAFDEITVVQWCLVTYCHHDSLKTTNQCRYEIESLTLHPSHEVTP
jgi:hypothetical protein